MGSCIPKSDPSIPLGEQIPTGSNEREIHNRAHDQRTVNPDKKPAIKRKIPYGTDKVYVAIYDYDARTDEDLTFRVGDLLKIIDDRLVVFSRFFLKKNISF
jgi:fyn-related kinase